MATRRILSGENMIGGDIEPPASQLKRLLEDNKTELSAVPASAFRMISMDTSEPPFDDIDVRKAVIAGFNRTAARQQRGGEAIGPIAHALHPAGHGRLRGVRTASKASTRRWTGWRRRRVTAHYRRSTSRRPAFASGKYEGTEKILLVGDNSEPDKSIAQITEQQLNEMGFKTTLRLVERSTMFTKFCGVPKSGVHVCPSVGWIQDFADPQTMLDPTFNGENILQIGNVNWPELDVPAVNKAIDAAKLIAEPTERAQAWADANKAVDGAGAGDPLHWDYRPASPRRTCAGAERVQHALGPQLHLAEVVRPSHRPTGPSPRAVGRSARLHHVMAAYIARRLARHGSAADPRQRGHVRRSSTSSRRPTRRCCARGASRRRRSIARIRADLGLDRPIYVQFGDYIYNVFVHQDFGHSYVNNTEVLRPDPREPAGHDLARRSAA